MNAINGIPIMIISLIVHSVILTIIIRNPAISQPVSRAANSNDSSNIRPINLNTLISTAIKK